MSDKLKKQSKRLNSDNTSIFLEEGVDVDNRIIHLFDDIEQHSTSRVIRGLQLMVLKNKELPVHIYINSFGGDIYSGFGLFDFIRSLEIEVHVYVVGTAMSAASVVLMSGDYRYMYENSKIMLHSASGGIEGKSFEIVNDAEEHKRIHQQMAEIYASRSGIDYKKWVKDLKYENLYYRAKEALELGLIDTIIKK
jgi:ATP-dependent Clp protease protease subunit